VACAGENDYICNYYGGREWTRVLEWKGKEGFQGAGEHDWAVNGQAKGTARSYGGLTFLSIKDAGHMVPMDQPEAAQVLLNTFLQGKNFY
jgi:carboxypeptidase C (cathepsin A)